MAFLKKFIYMHVCLHVVLTETRRRCQIPLHWIMSHCKLSHESWELNLSTLQKQLLTALNHLSQLLYMVCVP